MAYSWEQLFERSGDLRPSKRFRNQKYFLGIAGTEARVSLLRRVTDDDDGKSGVIRVITHGVEERLAHIVDGTIEHEGIGALLNDELINGGGIAGGENVVAAVAQRKRQQLGDFRRVVDEQDAPQAAASSCLRRAPGPGPTPGRRPCSRRGDRFRTSRPRPPACASRRCIPRNCCARGSALHSCASCW